MRFSFQTLRSGSGGNCLLFRAAGAAVLVDCGVRSQRGIRDVVEEVVGGMEAVDAVVVTHAHGDHVNYSTLRVLEEEGVPLLAHRECAWDILERHSKGRSFDGLRVEEFGGRPFEVGGMEFTPVEVPHAPGYPTFALVVRAEVEGEVRKAVVVSDCSDWSHAVGEFRDADLIYLEANHDPGLLEMYPNPNSRFHMANHRAGDLLAGLLSRSSEMPRNVILGHLSRERNEPSLARETVLERLALRGLPADFRLEAAPRSEASEVFTV